HLFHRIDIKSIIMSAIKNVLIITGDAGESFEILYATHRCVEAGGTAVIGAPSVKRMNVAMHDFAIGWDTYWERKGYVVEYSISCTAQDAPNKQRRHCFTLGGRS